MINSRVKVQYWMNDRMVSPSDNLLLYPHGSDVVSEVYVFDADWTDTLWDDLDSAWNFANGVLSVVEGNLLSTGFPAVDFGRSINNIKNALSDKVGTKAATLAIVYPNELFNIIRVVFEADAGDKLKSPVASPPTNPPLFQYNFSTDVGNHQRAEYIINLDKLRAQMGDDKFYGSADPLDPRPSIAFAFADAEDDETITLSVLQTLSISFHYHGQLPPMVTTDIYYLRGPNPVEPGNLVEAQRLMQYTPTIEEMTPGSGHAWQSVIVSLERFSDGSYRINGQPYECIMLWFQVISLRGYDTNRPKIEIIGEVKPENMDILRPQVWQPVPFLSMDTFGQRYQAEGSGSALTPSFNPSNVPPGTHKIFFMANQNLNWDSAQVVHLRQSLFVHPIHPL
jgi:hypothetical protein